jgi:GYF domain 2
MTVEWYVQTNDRTLGPLGPEELERLAQTGRLLSHTLVRAGGDGAWRPAGEATDLFNRVATSATNPPPVPLPDEWESDHLPYAAPPSAGGRAIVTAFGVVTLVLASLLAIAGCTSGVGSIFCFTASNTLLQQGQANSAPAGPGAPAAPPGQSCSAMFATIAGGILLVLAFILVAVMVSHLALAGGHFAVGVGVLRRRPWARILALVLSGFTAIYGLAALAEVIWRLFQSPLPADYEIGGQVLTALVGLVFTAHATLTWVVMFHPACAGQFRPPVWSRPGEEPA